MINEIKRDRLTRICYSRDASMYSIMPEAVSKVRSEHELTELLKYSRDVGLSVTFRASGTSLSGQALGRGIIADISWSMDEIKVHDRGMKVTCGPGAICGTINKKLAPHGRKLGPDPASINYCTAGGITANNSSGMSSGIGLNPYNTMQAIRFVMADGHIYDSRNTNEYKRFSEEQPKLSSRIMELRNIILENEELKNKITRKYRLKNTTGYSLNSFLDYKEPFDIFCHLLVGSEGTLAFISSVTYGTVAVENNNTTGLAYFEDFPGACSVLPAMKGNGATVLEVMDRTCMKSVEDFPGVPKAVKGLSAGASALLFELPEDSGILDKAKEILKSAGAIDIELADGKREKEQLWAIRRGLLTSLSAGRSPGTSVIIEDLAFDIDKLAMAVADLQQMMIRYGFSDTGIYGHGTDGNIHFMIAADFSEPGEVANYSAFMQELVGLVIDKYDGSLKAEHGTGRNMAPFVRREWGDEAYEIMRRLKELADPENIFNPGVLISSDSQAHISGLKPLPLVDEIIDKCIECGFCESNCPSREYTLTPRKRIALLREFAGSATGADIENEFRFAVIDTCAVDGLCQLNCPAGINTGEMVKKLRQNSITKMQESVTGLIFSAPSVFESTAKSGLRLGNALEKIVGIAPLQNIVSKMGAKAGMPEIRIRVPLPLPATVPETSKSIGDFVYFPCCTSRMMGGKKGRPGLPETVVQLSKAAGIKVIIPDEINGHCCGMAFSSKGLRRQYTTMMKRTVEMLWDYSCEGTRPVIFDSSSCAYTIKCAGNDLSGALLDKYLQMEFLDSAEYLHDYLIDSLELRKIKDKVALHITCSSRKMGIGDKIIAVARRCAENVFVPDSDDCCGMAGDRGWLYPGLTEAATRRKAMEILEYGAVRGYSNNTPCELNMQNETKLPFDPLFYLVSSAKFDADR